MFTLMALSAVVLAQAAESNASARAPGLHVEHLYHGVNRPVMIEAVSPRSFGNVTLVLMDADGQPLAAPIDVHPGRIDLAEKMPSIWQLPRAAFLQMISLNEPVGAALVLQPMLARLVPVTEQATRPTTGAPYTRIVGWRDENQPPPPPPPPPEAPAESPAEAPATTQSAAGELRETASGRSEEQADEVAVPRLCTGLRIYPEQDVILHTDKGDIRVALRPDQAPNTAWNFLELSRGGFYRETVFHRVVKFDREGKEFVIQGGDPTGTGDGGPGYWLPIEDSQLPHDLGVISMARSDDPDSNGSQFFFCLSREGTARLDGQYCAFGYAVSGAAAIKAIAEVELADVDTGRPAQPPVISDAEVVPAPPRTPGKGRPDARITAAEARQPETKPRHVPR